MNPSDTEYAADFAFLNLFCCSFSPNSDRPAGLGEGGGN